MIRIPLMIPGFLALARAGLGITFGWFAGTFADAMTLTYTNLSFNLELVIPLVVTALCIGRWIQKVVDEIKALKTKQAADTEHLIARMETLVQKVEDNMRSNASEPQHEKRDHHRPHASGPHLHD